MNVLEPRWFRYVRRGNVAAREAEGWKADDCLGPTHGHWSVLMEWSGPGDPPNDDTTRNAANGDRSDGEPGG